MKKTRSLLLSMASLVMAGGLILSACAPAATQSPTAAPTQPPAATTAPTEAMPKGVIAVEDGASIVFSGWGDETEQKIYNDSIVRFNAVYPGVKVDYQPIPSDFETKLKAGMAGGTAPDVFYVNDQAAGKANDVRMAGAATHAEENNSDQPADRIAVELK